MDPRINVLRQIPLFAMASQRDLNRIAEISTFVRIAKGTVIIEQGASGQAMYVLLRGKVTVEQGKKASRMTTIAERGPGDVIGEMALIDDQPRSARVVASTTCRALQIRREDFRREIYNDLGMCHTLLRGLVSRLREATDEMAAFRNESLETKVLRRLRSVAIDGGEITVNQTQLARSIGCTREALNRKLRGLVESGDLEKIGRGKFRLK